MKNKTILGIKISHDAGIAAIEDGHLLFATEFEKIGNGDRYGKLRNWKQVSDEMAENGLTPHNCYPIYDGWKHGKVPDPETRYPIMVANYHEFETDHEQSALDCFPCENGVKSYFHMTGHILGAYCTSPFAKNNESAYVISWDGGQSPRIHLVDPKRIVDPVSYQATIHGLHGMIYSIMGMYFGPWAVPEIAEAKTNPAASGKQILGWRNLPGKLMALIARGKVHEQLFEYLFSCYQKMEECGAFSGLKFCMSAVPEHSLMKYSKWFTKQIEVSDIDVLATIHSLLQVMLVNRALEVIPQGANLCFVGGSALNIKWNSALRRTGHFANVWVPPFPNDSGSAIGAACCEMVCSTGNWALDWDLYSGPLFNNNGADAAWGSRPTAPGEVAHRLALFNDRPIIVLSGRAELGPRALGHRSILMAATRAENKNYLNQAKGREGFRPVAPICLEERAAEIFNPGGADPYMLFEHEVKEEWRERIPAIVHLDGSARLQTVGPEGCPMVRAILKSYEAATGIPLLCNTSANSAGKGFFPDLRSSTLWASMLKVEESQRPEIYTNGILYSTHFHGNL